MSEPSVQEELSQQLLDQKESLREISEMLAVDPSEQLQQVLQLCSQHGCVYTQPCIYRCTTCLQLYEELLAGLQETQSALAEYEPLINNVMQPGPPDTAAPALQRPCRSAL